MALVVAGSWSAAALRRTTVALLACGAVLVGAAMVYLGAHWLTDVLAGWGLGAAVGAIAGGLVRGPTRTRAEDGAPTPR